jgi:hypothetical protein
MTARVGIDLNVRLRGGLTYAGFEDSSAPLAVGEHVRVYERESGLEGPGEVVEVDEATRLVYLKVAWAELREPLWMDDRPSGVEDLMTVLCARPQPGPLAALYRSSTSSGIHEVSPAARGGSRVETIGGVPPVRAHAH